MVLGERRIALQPCQHPQCAADRTHLAEAQADHADPVPEGGDAPAIVRLPHTIVGRVAYPVRAGLEPAPRTTKELYRGAPYGVGYYAGVWYP